MDVVRTRVMWQYCEWFMLLVTTGSGFTGRAMRGSGMQGSPIPCGAVRRRYSGHTEKRAKDTGASRSSGELVGREN